MYKKIHNSHDTSFSSKNVISEKNIKVRGRKISYNDASFGNKKNVITKKESFSMNLKILISKILQKNILVYLLLFFVDICLIIYFAKRNTVNYVEIIGERIFIGKNRYLLVGRNYITLVVTFFFFVYTVLVQKFFFKRKITRKYMIGVFFIYLILNLVLFFIFTKRVY